MELTDITIQKIEDFLKSLVKTAKILRFYPENNPMGQVAIDHCLECLAELETDRQFALTVTPENLFIGETSITMAHPGLRQLARQLYILGIENLAFQNNITEKEIKGFCQLLGMDPKEIIEKKGLSKVLAEKTIEHIRIVESQMPGIVEVSKTSTKFFINSIPNKRELNQNLTQENETQKSVGPRSKAVIKINANLKIDPDLKIGADLDLSSLSPKELTKIVDNPEYLVEALLRPSKVQPLNVKKWGTSTGKKFRKTQQLLETLEGWEKSKTLDKISRTMLKMDPDYKDQLTRDCLVPALLEGREEGEILRFLTDSNLAQSISLLGKLDTSTPHTLQKTLLKLHLPERRQSLFLPMLEKELKKRGFQTTNISLLQEQKKANKIAGLDRKNQDLAEKQLPSVVHLNQIKNPDWFLNSLDKQMLKNIRSNPVGIDSKKAELRCLINLTRLEDNLEICRGFISRISDILEKLLKEKQWKSLTFWLNHLRAMNKMISDTKPAIFSLVKEKLSSIDFINRIQYLVKQCSQDNCDKI